MSLRPADRRRAVEELLRDEEWREWNDRQIARHCGVDGHRELGTIKARPAPYRERALVAERAVFDVRRVVRALPERRQSLLFSATMPPEIARLAESILRNPVRIAVDPVASTVDRVKQRVMFVERAHKRPLLSQVLKDPAVSRALVFTRTKHGANRVAEELARSGVQADAIHGNKSQAARTRALERFRTGAGRVLVATDIAARGIDVDGITHVNGTPEHVVRTVTAGSNSLSSYDRSNLFLLH